MNLFATVLVHCREIPEDRLLGVQRGEAIEQLASSGNASFTVSFDVDQVSGGGVKFKGPYAKGRLPEQFFYLAWAELDADNAPKMVARLKVHLSHLTWEIVEEAALSERPLTVEMSMTDRKGGVRCGSIKSGEANWS